MMYLVELEREIELQPCFFGPRLREVLEQKLHSEVVIFTMSMHPLGNPSYASPCIAWGMTGRLSSTRLMAPLSMNSHALRIQLSHPDKSEAVHHILSSESALTG